MMSFSVEELASQICLLDQELFAQIPAWEFCVQAWKKKKDRGAMPCLHINAFNTRHAAVPSSSFSFSFFSFAFALLGGGADECYDHRARQLLAWIQSEIVSGKTTRERNARLGHCLKIIEVRQATHP
jgi:hypothetical protein